MKSIIRQRDIAGVETVSLTDDVKQKEKAKKTKEKVTNEELLETIYLLFSLLGVEIEE